ncbi:hypothetical protein KBB96_07070 [Luteolibacter ambystomatis]|uniref:Uncharacterized protein n=1 Tax=Luteolibacter ambystomatis TaxID=2824561 RepID=A0A975J274_9BACT|nr:hypothetical protein [Luteolibacter ambystomatis]QUE52649.1 hypothetical protein KBB96_07070 [Luteolibacter ambystomatis]
MNLSDDLSKMPLPWHAPPRLQRFRIERFKNPSGKQVWRVDGYRSSGGRIRENFKTKSEALERMNALEQAEAEGALSTVPVLQRTILSAEQISDAESATAMVPGRSLAALAAHLTRWETQAARIGLSVDEALAF